MRGTRGMRCALAVLLILALSLGWGAALAATQRSSDLIVTYTITRGTEGNGKVYFTANIETYDYVDRLGFSAIHVYDEAGNIKKSAYSQYASNARSHSYTISYDGIPGEKYRVHVCFYAKDGSIVDSGKTRWSSYVTAQ